MSTSTESNQGPDVPQKGSFGFRAYAPPSTPAAEPEAVVPPGNPPPETKDDGSHKLEGAEIKAGVQKLVMAVGVLVILLFYTQYPTIYTRTILPPGNETTSEGGWQYNPRACGGWNGKDTPTAQ